MALSTPLLVGIYENKNLIKEISSQEKASEVLIDILQKFKNLNIKSITYTNGPGSFMGVKTSYVILKTFCIATGCKFLATTGFELNGFNPIKANNNLSFIYENGKIKLKKMAPVPFNLPINLLNLNRSYDTLPNYIIDAV